MLDTYHDADIETIRAISDELSIGWRFWTYLASQETLELRGLGPNRPDAPFCPARILCKQVEYVSVSEHLKSPQIFDEAGIKPLFSALPPTAELSPRILIMRDARAEWYVCCREIRYQREEQKRHELRDD